MIFEVIQSFKIMIAVIIMCMVSWGHLPFECESCDTVFINFFHYQFKPFFCAFFHDEEEGMHLTNGLSK